jgi:hypothetical protein
MRFRLHNLCALAVSLLALAFIGAAVPALPQPPNAAMIYNPGSGDYAGFRIVISPDGRAIAIDGAGHTSAQVQSDLVDRFFADLGSAGPLAQLPAKPCGDEAGPSASTTVEVNAAITISWKGQHSGLLRCATDVRAQKLLLDATEIQRALYVQAYRTRNLRSYGLGYAPSAPATYGNVPDYRVTFDQFYFGTFNGQPLRFDNLTTDHFSSGITFTTPFTGSPFTGAPTTSLPTSSIGTSSPFVGLPGANPFVGLPGASPYSSLPNASPFSGGLP